MSQTERREFQAEVKQLLDLMIHSLYSNKDVFLRELISNASDALDKRRFAALTAPELGTATPVIELSVGTEPRTLTISDNGIGMSRDEVVRNIGTIAKSGTKEFLAAARASKQELTPELIGQFGVGFYAAFMVADQIELVTRRAGETTATRWLSVGDGGYELEETHRDEPGTTIKLWLKPADAEHGMRDYAAEHELRSLVKRYSDFVTYPIRFAGKDEQINSGKAIWDRAKGEVTEAEYHEFYRHIAHDWQPPWRTVPVKIEGTIEANALLFVPKRAPADLYSPEMKRGLQLYVKRVFVMDECRDLMPSHLRFVKGVVDAHDLSLNVSREILQQDRQIQVIRKQLVKKVVAALEEAKRDAWGEYVEFWGECGPVLKEGLLGFDAGERDKLLELVVAASTHSRTELTSLASYVERMKPEQEAIYVLTGPKENLADSPLLEGLVAKGYEVLLFSDPVDDLWLDRVPSYRDKKIVHIAHGEVELGSEAERKEAKDKLADQQREMSDLLTCLRVHLQDEIKEVRLSQRLTSSPVCLVSDADAMTPRMQRILQQMGQTPPKVQRILELNPEHPLVPKLRAIFAANRDDARLKAFAQVLLGQAHLADSGQVPDAAAFSQALGELMTAAAQ